MPPNQKTKLHVVIGGAAGTRPGTHPGNVWITPPWFADRIAASMGGRIALDPCTEAHNPIGAARFYTVKDDGLAKPWNARTIYVNPPYSDVAPWIRKAIVAAARGARVYMLLPVRTDADYHHELLREATDVLLIQGRLRFLDRNGKKAGSPAFCSMLVGLGISTRPLADLGVVVVPTAFGIPRSA